MPLESNTARRILLALSLALAYLSFATPSRQMPLDFHAMLTISIPLSLLWVFLFAISLRIYRKRAKWVILGAPLALWLPIWLLINGLPSCYHSHNCI